MVLQSLIKVFFPPENTWAPCDLTSILYHLSVELRSALVSEFVFFNLGASKITENSPHVKNSRHLWTKTKEKGGA